MPERKCQECGDTLRGRADQKYCSDQCRNAFNNKLMSETNNMIRQINRILKKNQLILSFLNPAGKTTVSQSDLLINGFNFNYFTNVYATQNGRVFHFCYDHGYSMVDSEKVLLVQKEGFVDEYRFLPPRNWGNAEKQEQDNPHVVKWERWTRRAF